MHQAQTTRHGSAVIALFSSFLLCTSAQAHLLLKDANLDQWIAFSQHRQTSYERTMDLEQGVVLRAESQDSASGYERRVNIALARTPILSWLWAIEYFPSVKSINSEGIEVTVNQFDEQHPASRDFALSLTVGRHSLWGSKTVHYVWSSQLAAGAQWRNSENSFTFVVNGPEHSVQRWQYLQRDVAADWQSAFGESIDQIDYVYIMTDTDNTQGTAAGYYGDIEFIKQGMVATSTQPK